MHDLEKRSRRTRSVLQPSGHAKLRTEKLCIGVLRWEGSHGLVVLVNSLTRLVRGHRSDLPVKVKGLGPCPMYESFEEWSTRIPCLTIPITASCSPSILLPTTTERLFVANPHASPKLHDRPSGCSALECLTLGPNMAATYGCRSHE